MQITYNLWLQIHKFLVPIVSLCSNTNWSRSSILNICFIKHNFWKLKNNLHNMQERKLFWSSREKLKPVTGFWWAEHTTGEKGDLETMPCCDTTVWRCPTDLKSRAAEAAENNKVAERSSGSTCVLPKNIHFVAALPQQVSLVLCFTVTGCEFGTAHQPKLI